MDLLNLFIYIYYTHQVWSVLKIAHRYILAAFFNPNVVCSLAIFFPKCSLSWFESEQGCSADSAELLWQDKNGGFMLHLICGQNNWFSRIFGRTPKKKSGITMIWTNKCINTERTRATIDTLPNWRDNLAVDLCCCLFCMYLSLTASVSEEPACTHEPYYNLYISSPYGYSGRGKYSGLRQVAIIQS